MQELRASAEENGTVVTNSTSETVPAEAGFINTLTAALGFQ